MSTALLKLRIRTMKVLEAKKERGATAVEYGLMVALIAVVITVGVGAFGTSLNTFFDGLPAKIGL